MAYQSVHFSHCGRELAAYGRLSFLKCPGEFRVVPEGLISAGPKALEDGKADGIQVIQNAAPVVQLVAAGDQQHVEAGSRQAARQAIRDRKIEEATEDWMRQIRDRAYVEYRNDD